MLIGNVIVARLFLEGVKTFEQGLTQTAILWSLWGPQFAMAFPYTPAAMFAAATVSTALIERE